MAWMAGIILALAASLFVGLAGFNRDRWVYPAILVVIACLYDLFAILAGAMHALALESIGMVVFLLAALAGFRFNLWIVVAALAGHGVFDLFHSRLIADPGVPVWWPLFCLSYDVVAALCLAWLLLRPTLAARPARIPAS
jgi:hypothetical protein